MVPLPLPPAPPPLGPPASPHRCVRLNLFLLTPKRHMGCGWITSKKSPCFILLDFKFTFFWHYVKAAVAKKSANIAASCGSLAQLSGLLHAAFPFLPACLHRCRLHQQSRDKLKERLLSGPSCDSPHQQSGPLG